MFRLGLTVVTVALVAALAPAQKPAAGTVDFTKGFAIAQAEVPKGHLVRARTEVKQGVPVFGFYFWVDGLVYEVEVSRTGKIIKKTDGDVKKVSEDVVRLLDKNKTGKGKIPDGRLMEIAADALKGTPLSDLRYETLDGKLVARVGDLVIDAETGKIISSK